MSGMRYNQIVRSKDGTQSHIQNVDEIKIPDLWHAYMAIKDKYPDHADAVLETWHLCRDLLKHVKRVCVEPNSE